MPVIRAVARRVYFISTTTAGAANTATTPSVSISEDGGAAVAATNAATHIANGTWVIQLTAAEMTADEVAVCQTATGCVPGTVLIYPENDYTVARAAFLDAAISSRHASGAAVVSVTNDVGITQAGADKVWASATRTLTDKANFSLTTLESGVQHSGTAQAGAATTITLAAGASATNDLYNGQVIAIYGATGAGQTRVITGYVGATKVATVDRAWATNPDATSTYKVLASSAPKLNSSHEVVAASVTGAVGSVTGAVGSVTGAVGSVTGAVGSVTGNVGGNVVGSVGSVTGAVGSVTGAVGSVGAGGIAAASFAAGAIDAAAIATGAIDADALAAGTLTAAKFAAGAIDAVALATDAGQEIADRIVARNIGGGSDTGRTIKQALSALRNRWVISAGTLTVYDTDDTTVLFTAAITTAAGNPVVGSDPA